MLSLYKYRIIWSPKSIQDLNNIYFYICYNLTKPQIAKNITKIILNSINTLSYLPERYVKIHNISTNKNIRKLIIHNYIVIYEVDKDKRSSIHFAYLS